MATCSPSFNSDSAADTQLHTPMVTVRGSDSHAAGVLRPASFTLSSPVNQKKRKLTPPPGFLALRVSVESFFSSELCIF